MKRILGLIGFILVASILYAPHTEALGLQVAPLEYRVDLKKGEVKKGFIDISNPGTDTLIVKTSVRAFRQTDDRGSLQFFEDPQLSAGVKLDLDEFELGPREALRMYFLVDGTKLPSGDVFGGIFFTTDPLTPTIGTGQSVKLGTLLSIVNGTPGSRQAEITKLEVPSLQFDTTVRGSYVIKNTADPSATTGFYPKVKLSTSPFGQERTETSKLVFAGRSRENNFILTTPPLGIYKVQVAYGDNVQSKWVFVMHPVALVSLSILVAIGAVSMKVYRRHTGPKAERHIPSR